MLASISSKTILGFKRANYGDVCRRLILSLLWFSCAFCTQKVLGITVERQRLNAVRGA